MSRLKSFYYAFRGLSLVWRSEPNMRIHLLVAGAATAFGIWLHISVVEWSILALTIGAVITAECFNTALEHLTDLVSPHHHPLAGKAKDAAAAAVLVAAIAAVTVACCIFLPRMIRLLNI